MKTDVLLRTDRQKAIQAISDAFTVVRESGIHVTEMHKIEALLRKVNYFLREEQDSFSRFFGGVE
jgi:hypothetical protein